MSQRGGCLLSCSSPWRWGICHGSTFQRFSILHAGIALTSTDTGLIISAFQIGYVLVVVSTGWLADREPEKNPLLRHLTIRGLFSPVHMGCSG